LPARHLVLRVAQVHRVEPAPRRDPAVQPRAGQPAQVRREARLRRRPRQAPRAFRQGARRAREVPRARPAEAQAAHPDALSPVLLDGGDRRPGGSERGLGPHDPLPPAPPAPRLRPGQDGDGEVVMTDKELIDAFVAGELDEAGMAQLEAELRAHPELVRELSEQQQMEQALKILLGDDTADQQVTVSVLSVLRADPLDAFKKDLLAEVQQEAELRRREEASAKIPVLPPPPPAPVEEKPVLEIVPPARVARRRILPWIVAGAVAAAG